MEYGVGITNRYAFLDDDVEDIVIEKQTVTPPEKGKVVKKNPGGVDKNKKDKPQGQKDNNKDKKVNGAVTNPKIKGLKGDGDAGGNSFRPGKDSSVTRGRGGSRGGGGRSDSECDRDKENHDRESKFNDRGNRSSRGKGGYNSYTTERRPSISDDWGDVAQEPQHRDREYGGEGSRGGRGSRGFMRGGGGGFTRRRDFDRLSGSDRSGIKPVDKRDGAGAHNWGTYKDEPRGDELQQSHDDFYNNVESDQIETENGQGDIGLDGMNTEVVETEAVGEMNDTEPKVEEPKLFTLEEWKAMQQPKSTPSFNIRKPNEGEDPSKWKNLVLKKKENLDDEDELIYEEDIWVPQRAGRQKLITDIGFHFVNREEQRSFRGRGGSGFKAQRQRSENGEGDTGADPPNPGYYGRGRGASRGFRRDRQGQRGLSKGIPGVEDVREWPSLIC